MTEVTTTTSKYWTSTQAFALAAVSLVLGVCGGMLIRRASARAQTPQMAAVPQQFQSTGASLPANFAATSTAASVQDLKKAADEQAVPLLEQLKADPNNAATLTNLGNIYYDAKQYLTAIQYYERSLKTQPADTSVRTDLGTAYWYNGDPDTAIAQFQKALSYEPNKADTLLNLGIVELQGKRDAKAAVAAWQQLLQANPGYQNKDKVLQLIADAQKH